MLKNILKLNGVQELSKNEQKLIKGTGGSCFVGCGLQAAGSICYLTSDCSHIGLCYDTSGGRLCLDE